MSSDHPTVSVVIPCYNQGLYIDEAVDSILSQSLPNLEIIIINDGSTEPTTIEIFKNYSKPKTKVIHTPNQGVSAARNGGIELAKGKYILCLDADDKIAPTYIEEAVELLENNERLGIIYSEAEFFGDQTGKWELAPYKFPDILVGNMIFCASLFRKEDWRLVGGYNKNMIDGWEDYDFWLSIIELGREVYQIPKTLFFYRRHSCSRNQLMELDKTKYINSYVQIFKNHQKTYLENIDIVFTEIIKLREQIERLEVHSNELQIKAEGLIIQKNDFQEQLERGWERIKQLEAHETELEAELRKTQKDWQDANSKLQIVEAEVIELKNVVNSLKNSKIWKIREIWLKVKRLLLHKSLNN